VPGWRERSLRADVDALSASTRAPTGRHYTPPIAQRCGDGWSALVTAVCTKLDGTLVRSGMRGRGAPVCRFCVTPRASHEWTPASGEPAFQPVEGIDVDAAAVGIAKRGPSRRDAAPPSTDSVRQNRRRPLPPPGPGRRRPRRSGDEGPLVGMKPPFGLVHLTDDDRRAVRPGSLRTRQPSIASCWPPPWAPSTILALLGAGGPTSFTAWRTLRSLAVSHSSEAHCAMSPSSKPEPVFSTVLQETCLAVLARAR